MYALHDPLESVKGIGSQLAQKFADKGIFTIKDLVLSVPYRYEDRSKLYSVAELSSIEVFDPKAFYTVKGKVTEVKNRYLPGGRTLQSAKVSDGTGSLRLSWFNNHFIVERLQKKSKNALFIFSGKVERNKGWLSMLQPICEEDKAETIHTSRLVPVYSTISGIPASTVRKLLKEVCDGLKVKDVLETLSLDNLGESKSAISRTLSLSEAIKQIHFPDTNQFAIQARERLALEELLVLIEKSRQVKEEWKQKKTAIKIKLQTTSVEIPSTIPFKLTSAQIRCTQEILQDISSQLPMNRILIGDVGSGKTIVAGLAMQKVVESGYTAALVAPTQILAEQHAKTLSRFFPQLPIYLITSHSKPDVSKSGIIVGTHAVLNVLKPLSQSKAIHQTSTTIVNTALIVFDEQHRFGVSQRSDLDHFEHSAHILTMTATPIPRSLMLTIFSHLSLSVIDELPKNRIPTKTWVVGEEKRTGMYEWLKKQITSASSDHLTSSSFSIPQQPNHASHTFHSDKPAKFQIIMVCPFIDPSNSQAMENVASAKDMYNRVQKVFNHHQVSLLHARLKKKEKEQVIADLFDGKIDVLVTTPIVEVGVDLPQASAIVIEASERFGMASLHQLRGRVGRAGQQGYCLLFTNSKGMETKQRLKQFSETLSGQKLSELDLKRRGAGDLFGTIQHGFDDLQFANWTDVELIQRAKMITDAFEAEKSHYQSPLFLTMIQTRKKIGAN